MKIEPKFEQKMEDRTENRSHAHIMCPTCRKGELNLADDTGACTDCGASFPVVKGVLDLSPTTKEPPAGAFMEADWFVQLYESRLWRRNPIFSVLLGISFDKELELIMNIADLEGDETFLDIGCGPGIYTRPFAKRLENGTAVGIDLSMPVLDYAVRKAEAEKIENLLFIHGDALHLPFPDNEFDTIICCGALHLFPYPEVLQGVGRILKPGGRFIVAAAQVPNMGPFSRKARDWYHRKSGVSEFFPDELEALLKVGGLTNIEVHHSVLWWLIMSGTKPG